MEKKKFQICEREHKSAIFVDWNRLPEEVIEMVDPELIYNVLCLKESGYIDVKTVVCFRPVKKFQKDVIVFEAPDNIEFGV